MHYWRKGLDGLPEISVDALLKGYEQHDVETGQISALIAERCFRELWNLIREDITDAIDNIRVEETPTIEVEHDVDGWTPIPFPLTRVTWVPPEYDQTPVITINETPTLIDLGEDATPCRVLPPVQVKESYIREIQRDEFSDLSPFISSEATYPFNRW